MEVFSCVEELFLIQPLHISTGLRRQKPDTLYARLYTGKRATKDVQLKKNRITAPRLIEF